MPKFIKLDGSYYNSDFIVKISPVTTNISFVYFLKHTNYEEELSVSMPINKIISQIQKVKNEDE